jgi:hypothetical protein
MEGFSHLPEIRTAKPHLPQVDVEGLLVASADGHLNPSC